MTTIAADLTRMAGDTQATNDQGIRSYCVKIHKKAGALIGFCGSVSDGQRFVKAYPDLEKIKVCGDFEALVLANGRLYHYESDLEAMPIKEPFFSIGSGAAAALGALHAGAGPVRAVKIAALVDIFTGGPVRSKKI